VLPVVFHGLSYYFQPTVFLLILPLLQAIEISSLFMYPLDSS